MIVRFSRKHGMLEEQTARDEGGAVLRSVRYLWAYDPGRGEYLPVMLQEENHGINSGYALATSQYSLTFLTDFVTGLDLPDEYIDIDALGIDPIRDEGMEAVVHRAGPGSPKHPARLCGGKVVLTMPALKDDPTYLVNEVRRDPMALVNNTFVMVVWAVPLGVIALGVALFLMLRGKAPGPDSPRASR